MIEFIIFGLILIMLIFAILSLKQYKKTNKKLFLIIGLILSLIVIGLLILILLQIYFYKPPHDGMVYGPGPF